MRAYEDARDGKLMVEWFEDVETEVDGVAVTVRKKPRKSLHAQGITTRAAAVEKVEALSAAFAGMAPAQPESPPQPAGPQPVLLGTLLDVYLAEKTPWKGASKQEHDRRAAAMFRGFFGAGAAVERVGKDGRIETEVGVKAFASFVEARRNGQIPGFSAVRDRAVEYDCKFLVAVFHHAMKERDDGRPLITRNPWGGCTLPREKNPRRPSMTQDLHALLLEHSINWRFSAIMELCRETIHRGHSVRQLAWADVDLRNRSVRWRGEFDKNGIESVTPLSDRAAQVLESVPRVLGSSWVFGAELDPARPVSRHTLCIWLTRVKRRGLASIEDAEERAHLAARLRGVGYHGQKRASVRQPEFRKLPAKVREKLTGTSAKTLDDIYDDVELEELREYMEGRRTA
ncbi:MAG TPA: tyrosine-type recombinase/integrase [Longimicrobium sp.]